MAAAVAVSAAVAISAAVAAVAAVAVAAAVAAAVAYAFASAVAAAVDAALAAAFAAALAAVLLLSERTSGVSPVIFNFVFVLFVFARFTLGLILRSSFSHGNQITISIMNQESRMRVQFSDLAGFISQILSFIFL